MNKVSMKIWGRECELSIEYDCYSTNLPYPYQKDGITEIQQNPSLINGILTEVIDYCLKENKSEIGETTISNIFKYVKPTSLYAQRTKDESHVVGLMCAYKFNPEHGLVIVFKDQKLDKIGIQDIIL